MLGLEPPTQIGVVAPQVLESFAARGHGSQGVGDGEHVDHLLDDSARQGW